jgi:gas vesicle protein
MIRDHKAGTIVTLILGAAVGAVVALLIAPQAGEELRDDVAAGVGDRVKHVRATGKNIERRAQEFVDQTKNQVQNAINVGDQARSHAKKA